MTASINSSPLRSILDAYHGHVLAAQARRLGAAVSGGPGRYSGPTPPAAVVNAVDAIKRAAAAAPPDHAIRRDSKPLVRAILGVASEHGLPDYSAWLDSTYAPDSVAISAEAAGPVFVTPANDSDGYAAGRAVLVVHGACALRPDLTIGPPIPAEAGLRVATQAEILTTLESWASRAGIAADLEWTGGRLIDAWADYSARAAGEAFGVGSAPTPSLADAIAKMGAPAPLAALFEAILSPEQKAAAAAHLGAGSAPAAPAPGPLPEVPALAVIVPTVSAGGFRSGSPVLVIGSNVGGGYLVWNGSAVVPSPAGARREHVRPADRDEARRFLDALVARVASAARAAA